MSRANWSTYFMKIAHDVSSRSTCLRRQVGAVIVRDRIILSTGYNGAPRGLPHCNELEGCLREKLNVPSGEKQELCRAVHSEQNALIQAARHGISIDGAGIYCTAFPCITCAKLLVNAGIKAVWYDTEYGNPEDQKEAMRYLKDASIEITQLSCPADKVETQTTLDDGIPDISYKRAFNDLAEACYAKSVADGFWDKLKEEKLFTTIQRDLEQIIHWNKKASQHTAVFQGLADVMIDILTFCGSRRADIGQIVLERLSNEGGPDGEG